MCSRQSRYEERKGKTQETSDDEFEGHGSGLYRDPKEVSDALPRFRFILSHDSLHRSETHAPSQKGLYVIITTTT